MTVRHDNAVALLDFHVFEVYDFDILIGHPIEKFLKDASTKGELDIKLDGKKFSIPISRSRNTSSEISPEDEPIEEVRAIDPFESPETLLEQEAEKFIREEDKLFVTPWPKSAYGPALQRGEHACA